MTRILCLLLALPVLFLFFSASLSILTFSVNGPDRVIQTILLPDKNIVLYEANGGATYSGSVRVYSEKKLTLGLIKHVDKLADYYRVKSLQLEYIGGNKFKVLSIDLRPLDARNLNTLDSDAPIPFAGDILEL